MFFEQNNLTAIEENIIDLCKIKNFTWIQYLKEKNEITEHVEFYEKDHFYVCYNKVMKYIEFYNLSKNNILYEIILKFKDNYFFFQVLYDDIFKKKNNKKNDFVIPEEIKNKKLFFYNDIISFKKAKEETVDNYYLEKCNINIKFLFKSEINIKKIILITKSKYEKIKLSIHSDYNNEVVNRRKTSNITNNITFFFFFHYDLMPLTNIYGFIYHNNNLASLIDLDYYFVNPSLKIK